jgi:enterobacteria phage integrase
MAPRRRKARNLGLPPGMRERRDGYYTWTDETDGTEYGLGRDRRTAIQHVIEVRMHRAGQPKATLLERLTGADRRTWSKACDEFEAILADRELAKQTRAQRKSQLKHLRTIVDKHKPVSEVETLELSNAIGALLKAGKRRTAQAFRTFLIDFFDRMRAKGWRKDNPAAVTDPITTKVRRTRLQFEAFMRLYETTSVEWLRDAMALAIVAGQAREEVSGAKVADIRDGHWWNERGKTGVRIQIPLELRLDCFGMSLGDVVKRCRSSGVLSHYLIHHRSGMYRGKKVSAPLITATFTAELAKLGLDWGGKEPPTFHEIRSLSGRLYRKQGDVNPQELYGHKSPGTTAVYLDERGEWVKVSVRRTTV